MVAGAVSMRCLTGGDQADLSPSECVRLSSLRGEDAADGCGESRSALMATGEATAVLDCRRGEGGTSREPGRTESCGRGECEDAGSVEEGSERAVVEAEEELDRPSRPATARPTGGRGEAPGRRRGGGGGGGRGSGGGLGGGGGGGADEGSEGGLLDVHHGRGGGRRLLTGRGGVHDEGRGGGLSEGGEEEQRLSLPEHGGRVALHQLQVGQRGALGGEGGGRDCRGGLLRVEGGGGSGRGGGDRSIERLMGWQGGGVRGVHQHSAARACLHQHRGRRSGGETRGKDQRHLRKACEKGIIACSARKWRAGEGQQAGGSGRRGLS